MYLRINKKITSVYTHSVWWVEVTFDIEDGSGPLEIFSLSTGGPFTINLENFAVDFCSES
jgi:hypothetical protein